MTARTAGATDLETWVNDLVRRSAAQVAASLALDVDAPDYAERRAEVERGREALAAEIEAYDQAMVQP